MMEQCLIYDEEFKVGHNVVKTQRERTLLSWGHKLAISPLVHGTVRLFNWQICVCDAVQKMIGIEQRSI